MVETSIAIEIIELYTKMMTPEKVLFTTKCISADLRGLLCVGLGLDVTCM